MNPKGKDRAESDPLFPNTQWSLVLRARDESTVSLNTLCGKYREPLLIWLRCRQHKFPRLDPEDLVNGFLASKLQQQILKTVTPDKGKFRSFVLTCLNNYVKDELDKGNAGMRGGLKPHHSIDETDEEGRPIVEPIHADPGADEAIDRAWGLVILGNATRRLEAELNPKGLLPLWESLQSHLYEEAEAPGYDQLAKKLGRSKEVLYSAALRIRHRLKALIREEVRETVASEKDFDDELKRFIHLFSRPHPPGAVL